MRPDHLSRRRPVRLIQATLLLILAVGLSACAMLPGNRAPQAILREASSLGLPADADAGLHLQAQWWQTLGDPQLNQLVTIALANHPSLNIAQARLRRAQAAASMTDAAAGPQLNAGVNVSRQLFTTNGLIPPPLAGTVGETAEAQLSGSWELDFFGKNRAALNAALGRARAVQAEVEAARMLLASQVARQYIQLARLTDQLAVAQRTLAQRQQTLQLVQDRFKAGLDTQLELRQSQSGLPEARYQMEALQEQVTLTRHALSALLGEPKQPLVLRDLSLAGLKNTAMPVTLPSDLLGRRPDIAAARWRVEAATQDISQARGQFYPSVNLVAFAGFSSIGLNRLLGAGSEQGGLGPALRLPLFDGGRLRANLGVKTADLDLAIESYNVAVIEAVREVADALTSRQSITRQQTEQGAAQALSESAYVIALQRYEAGLSNYLQVLSAETAVLNQRRQGVDLSARALDTQVALLRALGGGYRADLPVATAQN
jgi:NodT family efflux transporter outer membrane factor (OMF) lipoprotein